MLTSTAARIELLFCLANARSLICAHCVQSADLQVCLPTSFTDLPNDLSPEGPAAVGVAHKIRRTPFRGSRACWIIMHILQNLLQTREATPAAGPCQNVADP